MRIEELKGVGKVRLEALHKAGLEDTEQLIRRLPRDYIDYDDRTEVGHLHSGQRAVFLARIKKTSTARNKGVTFTYATVFDETGQVQCVWFNQPYRGRMLETGATFLFVGLMARHQGQLRVQCPQVLPAGTHGIEALYPPIKDVPPRTYSGLVRQAWEAGDLDLQDPLPQSLLAQFGMPSYAEALYHAHFPETMDDLAQAVRRQSFEDLLLFRIAVRQLDRSTGMGRALKANRTVVQPFLDELPYQLTGAQDRVLREALADMESDRPMARLVEGDVGCGKTVIAFALLACAFENGCQGAMMAPTEVLAQQHYNEAKRLLEPLGARVVRLMGAVHGKERKETLAALASGEANIVIGTHALITESVEYKNLGVIITDEQHRFGVRQRTALEMKGKLAPHVLVMSATPIPRTMALVLYGDLDVSVVDELPPGRKEVRTRIVSEKKRQDMYGFIQRAVEAGQQAYVVCPLVEDSEMMDAASAAQTVQEMRKAMPDVRIELLHGRMKSEEKDRILQGFAAHESDVLVSTTVIEVGVNVPNATIMVIEDAERFGLAQLHQLRGRVGRGDQQSWCFLMADPSERMKTMASTTDGFVIARKDLELRGPGELMGSRQSGMLDEKILRLASDGPLMDKVTKAVDAIFAQPKAEENRQLMVYARRMMEQRGLFVARN